MKDLAAVLINRPVLRRLRPVTSLRRPLCMAFGRMMLKVRLRLFPLHRAVRPRRVHLPAFAVMLMMIARFLGPIASSPAKLVLIAIPMGRAGAIAFRIVARLLQGHVCGTSRRGGAKFPPIQPPAPQRWSNM